MLLMHTVVKTFMFQMEEHLLYLSRRHTALAMYAVSYSVHVSSKFRALLGSILFDKMSHIAEVEWPQTSNAPSSLL